MQEGVKHGVELQDVVGVEELVGECIDVVVSGATEEVLVAHRLKLH